MMTIPLFCQWLGTGVSVMCLFCSLLYREENHPPTPDGEEYWCVHLGEVVEKWVPPHHLPTPDDCLFRWWNPVMMIFWLIRGDAVFGDTKPSSFFLPFLRRQRRCALFGDVDILFSPLFYSLMICFLRFFFLLYYPIIILPPFIYLFNPPSLLLPRLLVMILCVILYACSSTAYWCHSSSLTPLPATWWYTCSCLILCLQTTSVMMILCILEIPTYTHRPGVHHHHIPVLIPVISDRK